MKRSDEEVTLFREGMQKWRMNPHHGSIIGLNCVFLG
jgi:hypothetical protein